MPGAWSFPLMMIRHGVFLLQTRKEQGGIPLADGEEKPLTFRRVLLNTCQEEFEGATEQRTQILDEIAGQENITEEDKEYRLRKVRSSQEASRDYDPNTTQGRFLASSILV
eukprot:6550447-Pyramimonas_sp.AAC.1